MDIMSQCRAEDCEKCGTATVLGPRIVCTTVIVRSSPAGYNMCACERIALSWHLRVSLKHVPCIVSRGSSTLVSNVLLKG